MQKCVKALSPNGHGASGSYPPTLLKRPLNLETLFRSETPLQEAGQHEPTHPPKPTHLLVGDETRRSSHRWMSDAFDTFPNLTLGDLILTPSTQKKSSMTLPREPATRSLPTPWHPPAR